MIFLRWLMLVGWRERRQLVIFVITDLFNGFCHAETSSILLFYICTEIGTSVGGKLLCHFHFSNGGETVYFLFDPESSD